MLVHFDYTVPMHEVRMHKSGEDVFWVSTGTDRSTKWKVAKLEGGAAACMTVTVWNQSMLW